MPNLAKSTTEWKDMFREFCQYLRLWRIIRGLQFRFQKGRIRVNEINDTTDLTNNWTIVGAKRGINISEDGRLFVKLTDDTPGVGTTRVQLYMDSAKTQLVAQGDCPDGVLTALAAQNNSGLTGSVKCTNGTGSPAVIQLLLDIDETPKNIRAFDLLTTGDVAAFNGITKRVNDLGVSFQGLLNTLKAEIEQKFILTKMREFLKSTQTTVLAVTEKEDSNGDVQITYAGVLGELIDSMADNTVAQSIKQGTPATGTPVYDADNVGVGVLSSLGDRQNLEPGSMTLTCTAGKDTTLEEQFSVELISDIDGAIIRGRLPLKIKKQWESREVSVRLQLVRTITDANDGSGQLATYVVDGETLDNTTSGDLYATIEAGSFSGGNDKRVRWYSDATKLNLVAEGLRVGNGTVTMSPMNNSGLSGSCVLTYSTDDLDIIIHLNAFKEGDIITVPMTNNRDGIIQGLITDIWDIALPVNGSPTIPDDLIKENTDHIIAGVQPYL